MKQHSNCRNCGESLQRDFCSRCGQSASVKDMDWKFLWNDFRFLLFSYDASILLTLKDLLLRPGIFIKDFLSGKRVRRFSPVRLTLTLAAAYAALVSSAHIKIVTESQNVSSPSISIEGLQDWVFSHYGLVEVLLIPILGLAAYAAFHKKGFSLASHVAAAAYIASLNMIFKIFFLGVAILSGFRVPLLLSVLPTVATLGSLSLAYWQLFSNLQRLERVLRIFLTTLIFVLIFVGIIYLGLWLFLTI